MAFLLDTHVLLWAAIDSPRLSLVAKSLLSDGSLVYFSVASLWEVAIKSGLQRNDFLFDPVGLRAAALAAGYEEMPIRGPHALKVADLPHLHNDPFDRILLAQTICEQLELLTVDAKVLAYGSPARAI